MKFDIAYNTNCSLELNSGRQITLDSLIQARTYAGLLEGTPNSESNDRTIESAIAKAQRYSVVDGLPFLVNPERRDHLREPGDMASVIERQSRRPIEFRRIPEWLPQIECIGAFRSTSPARDQSMDTSSLVIVWYQDLFGFQESAIDLLKNVDWEKHAEDWCY